MREEERAPAGFPWEEQTHEMLVEAGEKGQEKIDAAKAAALPPAGGTGNRGLPKGGGNSQKGPAACGTGTAEGTRSAERTIGQLVALAAAQVTGKMLTEENQRRINREAIDEPQSLIRFMKIGKDTLNAARRLFRLCMDGNTVAEDRVRLIARKIAERKPRNYVALLTAFSRMVEYAVKSRTATIQSAVPLTEEERSRNSSQADGQIWRRPLLPLGGGAGPAGGHPHPGGGRRERRFRTLQNRPSGRDGPQSFQLTNETFFHEQHTSRTRSRN